MKKTIKISGLLLMLAGMTVSCNKGGNTSSPTNTMFYLSTNCNAGPETVTINGSSQQISYVFTNGTIPNCGDANTASFNLTAGTYTYTVKDTVSTRTGVLTVTANACNVVNVACDSFSASVRNVLPEYYIDSLVNWGMTIHAGLTPNANLTGIYLFSPNTLLHPYSDYDNYYIGQVIDDYKFKLYNQVNNSISLSLEDVSGSYSDTASGIAGYISGTDNSFSVFGQVSGVASSIPYTQVFVISGIMTSSGIQNMQEGFIITSKTGDDDNSVLIPVGTGRIFYDGDYLSTLSSTFRLSGGRLSGGLKGHGISAKK